MTRFVPLLAVSLTLAACAGREMVDLEARDMAVQQNAEPAAGAAGAADISSVAHLLPATSPTYVTLTVSQVGSEKSGTKAENNRRAKYYRITEAGRRRLKVETEDWRKQTVAIARLLAGS